MSVPEEDIFQEDKDSLKQVEWEIAIEQIPGNGQNFASPIFKIGDQMFLFELLGHAHYVSVNLYRNRNVICRPGTSYQWSAGLKLSNGTYPAKIKFRKLNLMAGEGDEEWQELACLSSFFVANIESDHIMRNGHVIFYFLLNVEQTPIVVKKCTHRRPKRGRICTYCADWRIREIEEKMQKLLQEISKDIKSIHEELLLPPKLQAASSITIQTLKRLFPGKWLNDSLIDFYTAYLTEEKFANQRENFIIYTTFFYTSLVQFCNGRKSFNRVQRPKNINIFEKHFVIIPVNWEENHWFTFVISHPCLIKDHLENSRASRAYVKCNEASKIVTEPRRPCMLILDSLADNRDLIFSHMDRFLREEYLRVNGLKIESLKLPGFYVTCPQQENIDDCGVFTLQNIEMFLEHMERFQGCLPELRHWYSAKSMMSKRLELMTDITDIIKKATEDNESP